MPGKTTRHAPKPNALTLAVAAAFLPWMVLPNTWAAEPPPPPAPNQLPTGGTIVGGKTQGEINANGNVMRIDQYVDRMIGKFQCFCIGESATVNVFQPSASSTALFSSTQAAQIFGHLNANGNVFITS